MKKIALLLADERNSYQQLLVEKAVESAARHKVEVLPPRFAEGKSIKQIG